MDTSQLVERIMTMSDKKQMSDTIAPPEGFNVVDYNEQEEIVTLTLHRHLLQHPQDRKAIINRFIEIILHGPNVRGVGAVLRTRSMIPLHYPSNARL
jgi:hypothetical protein